MNRKKVIKAIVLIIVFLLVTFGAYNGINAIRSGKQKVSIITNSKYYSGSNIEALIEVRKLKNSEPLKSKLKVELLDKDEKKVKGVKEKYNIDEFQKANLSFKLPENLETGRYYLKVTSKSGILKDVVNVPINIMEDKNTNIIISLDKGIYKPGDDINFRALLIMKKENIPEESEVSISIYDGNNNKVYSNTTKTSEYGIVSGKFTLADEVNSGTYKLVVSNSSKEMSKNFVVNPYITPKFEVNVTSDKETYIIGEKANITVEAKYFFGEPVQNANVVAKIGEKELKGLTDIEGKFIAEYNVEKVGKANFDIEVTDTSNYLIEANKTIIGSTNKYEIEILPEYGNLISGMDNDIYIVTKTASGEPVKTNNKIKIGTISRDVITDENGVKKFTLTSGDISTLNSINYSASNKKSKKYSSYEEIQNMIDINISSEDANGNKVSKIASFNIEKRTNIIETDKIKYNCGDDISISLNSTIDSNQNNLYICKGDELIKSVSFEGNDVVLNLENISGLIDIYLNSEGTSQKSIPNSISISSLSKYTKKTIFIKPSEKLNIGIETDSEQYSPKDTLNIKFTTTNEENSSVDSALLVSILDEAVLNLAENDLSIDNIQNALSDIKLDEGVNAADLYAEIIDEKSSGILLETLLLKQNIKNCEFITQRYNNSENSYKSFIKAGISGLILGIGIVIYCLKKYNKFLKGFLKGVIAIIEIFAMFLVGIISFEGLSSYFYNDNAFKIIFYLVFLSISMVLYFAIFFEKIGYIFKLILELFIIPIIYIVFIVLFAEIFDLLEIAELLVLLAGSLIIAWIFLQIRYKENRLSDFGKFVKTFLEKSFKGIVFWFIARIIIEFTDLGLIIALLIYMLLNKLLLEKNKTNKKKYNGKIVININGYQVIGIIVGIIILVGIYDIMKIRHFSSKVTDSMSSTPNYSGTISDDEDDDGYVWKGNIGSTTSSGGYRYDTYDEQHIREYASDMSGVANTPGSDFLGKVSENVNSLFTTNTSKEQNNADIKNEENEIPNIENVEKESETEENVRNVFLESLAFIPELVTENGTKDLSLKLSDNITTWNIQAVGNTKDGRLGASSKTFKVFKEFFVDFSLPTNSVITDKISIPVTVYNYTENELTIELNVKENDWCIIGEYEKTIKVPANSTNMVYVPLEIQKDGDNTLRIEAKYDNVTDIVEKNMTVKLNGIEKTEVSSSGTIEKDFSQDIIFKDDAINGSKKIKVKLYPSSFSQIIEGMENILKMPTGCFEQTSSSLYPDVLALEYLENNELNNEEIKARALAYISKGYQKLLTYEVKGTKGGYSLYGNAPAEPVITAFGLMEMKEISKVYNVDEHVIENMKEYLFSTQKVMGDFDYSSTYIGHSASTDKLAMNAYIIWALSEAYPEDNRLDKSVKYLENNLDKVNDNYTLALIANIFANTKNKETKNIIKRLIENVSVQSDGSAYVTSNIKDYYGSSGKYQNIQATALTSIALSKLDENRKTNEAFINYLIKVKDRNGTWSTTQSTVLALKAINDFDKNAGIEEQIISVNVNGQEQSVDINKDTLNVYEFEFNNISDENSITIGMKKGKIHYEIIKEYYQEYLKISDDYKISVTQDLNTQLNINDMIIQNIHIQNKSKEDIDNGIVQITIPQGCSVDEDSLLELKYQGMIEKYEYNYGKINVYLRNFTNNSKIDLQVKYRANYPEKITGASIRFFDYYNPEIEGICKPVEITVNK